MQVSRPSGRALVWSKKKRGRAPQAPPLDPPLGPQHASLWEMRRRTGKTGYWSI